MFNPNGMSLLLVMASYGPFDTIYVFFINDLIILEVFLFQCSLLG